LTSTAYSLATNDDYPKIRRYQGLKCKQRSHATFRRRPPTGPPYPSSNYYSFLLYRPLPSTTPPVSIRETNSSEAKPKNRGQSEGGTGPASSSDPRIRTIPSLGSESQSRGIHSVSFVSNCIILTVPKRSVVWWHMRGIVWCCFALPSLYQELVPTWLFDRILVASAVISVTILLLLTLDCILCVKLALLLLSLSV
jgi:hypothetical protein